MSDLRFLISELLSRPIAYHPIFAKVAGGATEGIFLSQLWYWSDRTTLDGEWFYKTGEDWEEETFLTRKERERARKKLKQIGILEEKKEGVPCRLFFRLMRDKLFDAIAGLVDQELTPDKVVKNYGSALIGLSKVGMMEASKKGVTKKEYVDYRKVVHDHGLTCSCCGEKITKGLGHDDDNLAIGYKVSLENGGTHTYDNMIPVHLKCSHSKDKQECSDSANQFVLNEQASLSKSYKQVCLEGANILYTENTSEITNRDYTQDGAGENFEISENIPDVIDWDLIEKQHLGNAAADKLPVSPVKQNKDSPELLKISNQDKVPAKFGKSEQLNIIDCIDDLPMQLGGTRRIVPWEKQGVSQNNKYDWVFAEWLYENHLKRYSGFSKDGFKANKSNVRGYMLKAHGDVIRLEKLVDFWNDYQESMFAPQEETSTQPPLESLLIGATDKIREMIRKGDYTGAQLQEMAELWEECDRREELFISLWEG